MNIKFTVIARFWLLLAFLGAFATRPFGKGAGQSLDPGNPAQASPGEVRLYLPSMLQAYHGGAPQAGGPTATPAAQPTATPAETQYLVAVGDGANCANDHDDQVARLISGLPGEVALLGDTVYEDGTAQEYIACYNPAWGKFKDRTHPAVGNHEYHTPGAQGYFDYFGASAGRRGQGYYSFNLGSWHLVVLNSMCAEVGGCQAGSAQEKWLRQDLAQSQALCTLAYFHHPRFSSGSHGSTEAMSGFWKDLYAAGVELVLNGHDHFYERYAPQDPDGKADPDSGLREIVVGTGGKSLHQPAVEPLPNSEKRIATAYGALQLALDPAGYQWQFLSGGDGRVLDAGSGTCFSPDS